MFQAYGRSFNYKNQTYLLSYCVYTAATIEVTQMKQGDSGAAERLETTLRMLETEAEQTPGIQKSIIIITNQLQDFLSSDQVNTEQIVDENNRSANQAIDFGTDNVDIGGFTPEDLGNIQWFDLDLFDVSAGFV